MLVLGIGSEVVSHAVLAIYGKIKGKKWNDQINI